MTKTYEFIVQVLEAQIEIERTITVASQLGLGGPSCDRDRLINAVITYFGPPKKGMKVKDYERAANEAWFDVLEHRLSIRDFIGLIASFCHEQSDL